MQTKTKISTHLKTAQKFTNGTVAIKGVLLKEGQKRGGVEKTPELMRKNGLLTGIKELNLKINDTGNIRKCDLIQEIESVEMSDKDYKYVLPNIETIGVMNHEL